MEASWRRPRAPLVLAFALALGATAFALDATALAPATPTDDIVPRDTDVSETPSPTTSTATITTTTTTTTITAFAPTTVYTSIPSQPSCQLPLHPSKESISLERGFRFGTIPNGWTEFTSKLKNKLKTKYEIAIELKTNAENGIIFYVDDVENHIDFVELHMKDGRLIHGFNCGIGGAFVKSENKYNDGQWHKVIMRRNQSEGTLEIDEKEIIQGHSLVGTKTEINKSYIGCLRNIKINQYNIGVPDGMTDVTPCSDKVERGAYFHAEGGFIKARNYFRVGEEMDIEMYIKPRNISGILLSVHGRRDFLLLQMVNGNIKFTVDNGRGQITTEFKPNHEHYLCDGKWHVIQAVKTSNVVMLAVDNQGVTPGFGMPGSSSTDTRHPLYIGGHAPEKRYLRGVTRDQIQYVGCIRDVKINNKLQTFTLSQAHGNVTIDFCPTI